MVRWCGRDHIAVKSGPALVWTECVVASGVEAMVRLLRFRDHGRIRRDGPPEARVRRAGGSSDLAGGAVRALHPGVHDLHVHDVAVESADDHRRTPEARVVRAGTGGSTGNGSSDSCQMVRLARILEPRAVRRGGIAIATGRSVS
jgi:hypothetical protein